MTNLDYARFLISDTDTSNQLFTDLEINAILDDNKEIILIPADKTSDNIFKIKYKRLDENYTEKFYDAYNNYISATIDKTNGQIETDKDVRVLKVQAKIIRWNDVLADLYEKIAADFRKLSNYSLSSGEQNYDDTKSILLRLARKNRTVRGFDL